MKTYDELLAERDALVAHVEACSDALKSLLKTPVGIGGSLQADGQFYYKVAESVFKKAESALAKTPQQCLAEIRAESGEIGYYNGFKDALVIEPPLPPATGTSATIDVFAYRVEQASRYAASQYAAKVRQGGE